MTVRADLTSRFILGDYVVDPGDERLRGPQGPIKLGNKAFRVLMELVEQEGRLVTKDALFSSVWDGTIVSESSLTSVVKELRRALCDDGKNPRYIESVYGRGYRLLEPVRQEGGAAPTAAPASPPKQAARMSGSPDPPLLYLPAFDDRMLKEAQPFLAEVLRDEILLALSRFRDLRLVSGTRASAPSAAETFGPRDYELGVRLVPDVEGVRAFVRMIRLSTQEIIWADRLRLPSEDAGQGVDLMIRQVAAALPRLYDDVARNLPPQTDDVYGIYLRNRLRMRGAESLEEMKQVAEEWESLIAACPSFGQSYPPLIFLYNTDFGYTGFGSSKDVQRRRAYSLARKALTLDRAEPHFHTVQAWCHLWSGESAAAGEHLREALELNPFHKGRLLEVATAFMFMGKIDDAAALLDRCNALTPFATETPHEERGLLHLLREEYREALDCLGRISAPRASSQLYALLAAAASGDRNTEDRARAFATSICRQWAGAEPLSEARLSEWVLYQHPFQQEARRAWVLELLKPVLERALEDPPHIRPRAAGERSSGRAAAAEGPRTRA